MLLPIAFSLVVIFGATGTKRLGCEFHWPPEVADETVAQQQPPLGN